jgi:predicted phage terminase large subunit-like protein
VKSTRLKDARKKKWFVLNAKRNSWVLVDNDAVLLLVGQSGGEEIPVYDLTVENQHEFFANGVLVHNSTADGGCYTAGVLIADSYDRQYWVEHAVRGQWSPLQRNKVIIATAERDAALYGQGGFSIVLEEEPASGGKESAETSIRELSGYIVSAKLPKGSKAWRLQPFAAQAEAGNVFLVDDETYRSAWIEEWLDELSAFPECPYKDLCDATSGSYLHLARSVYSYPASGGQQQGGAGPGGGGYRPGLPMPHGLPGPSLPPGPGLMPGGGLTSNGYYPRSELRNFRAM